MVTSLLDPQIAPSSCSSANADLISQLNAIVGRSHVLTGAAATRRYRTGFRFGTGQALAVVQPGSLVEQWRALKACIAAGKIVIMQAANTGLTGGSTPDGDDYDRDVVIVSTLRMAKLHLINGGQQVICFPGTTLYQLEQSLRPLNREPHSVIGSSCIGASVFGGICNNSGGSLIKRGPAFTQMALYARVNESGELLLINHLGVRLGDDPETILDRLDRRAYDEADIDHDAGRLCSDHQYHRHVRDIDAESPARFNADPRRLFEASGSAGRLILFAARLDTFENEGETKVFYIGTNDTTELTALRRHMLANMSDLPVAAEYMHRDAYDIAAKYGKDMFLAIQYLGTDKLPALFALKTRFDLLAGRLRFLPRDLSDRLMQAIGRIFPDHLPRRMTEYRSRYEHHLMLKVAGPAIEEARRHLASMFPTSSGAFFECSPDEASKAFLHRFAAAGAAVRYRAMHRDEIEDIVALDIALKRNQRDWFEVLPDEISASILIKLYYGHFFCHVFHQDYIVRKGHDPIELEHRMWKLLDQRGAEYPAEHNVGHLYLAKPALKKFYQNLDPCNCLNPGIGQTSKRQHWN
ncbi:MAG: D-lactate dehydrogenase [Geminicoccaceae bacterium]